MENIITAVTNIVCILPIYRALQNQDVLTALVITTVGLASTISHLAENHKYGMPGVLGVTQRTSWILNQMDIAAELLTLCRLLFLYLLIYGWSLTPFYVNPVECMSMLSPLTLLRISSYNNQNAQWKPIYLVCHNLWHITVFYSIYHYLTYFVY